MKMTPARFIYGPLHGQIIETRVNVKFRTIEDASDCDMSKPSPNCVRRFGTYTERTIDGERVFEWSKKPL